MPNGDDSDHPDVEAATLLEAGGRLIEKQMAELEELKAERDRLKKANEIASYNIIELSALRDMLSGSLTHALDLVMHLMADLREAGVQPSVAAVVLKTKLDYDTRTLVARYGKSLPIVPKDEPSQ
jgi:Tfp pilus assembly protein PilO